MSAPPHETGLMSHEISLVSCETGSISCEIGLTSHETSLISCETGLISCRRLTSLGLSPSPSGESSTHRRGPDNILRLCRRFEAEAQISKAHVEVGGAAAKVLGSSLVSRRLTTHRGAEP